MNLSVRMALAAALLAAAPLAGAAEPLLKQGDREVDFAGSLTRSTTDIFGTKIDSTVLQLSFRGGRVLAGGNEIGLGGAYVHSDIEGDTFSYGQVGPFFDVNFLQADSRIVPVIGASAQFVFGDFSGSAVEVSGGIRVFASDDVSVNTRVFYEMASLEDDGFDQDVDTLGVRIGFSWIIR